MALRVVAGSFGGRRIAAPRGRDTRPTSDRVREALFSILGDVSGLRVIDLFAGSGALGIEALSRGAESAVFVERSRAAAGVLRANLAALGLEAAVVVRDSLAALGDAARRGDQYDLALLDPPYGLAGELGPRLSSALPPVLAPGALAVTESDRRAPLPLDIPLELERRYGDTLIRLHRAP
jgi:16S rRNA (guanine(966)-N(2))-methyltransferase RsmD